MVITGLTAAVQICQEWTINRSLSSSKQLITVAYSMSTYPYHSSTEWIGNPQEHPFPSTLALDSDRARASVTLRALQTGGLKRSWSPGYKLKRHPPCTWYVWTLLQIMQMHLWPFHLQEGTALVALFNTQNCSEAIVCNLAWGSLRFLGNQTSWDHIIDPTAISLFF